MKKFFLISICALLSSCVSADDDNGFWDLELHMSFDNVLVLKLCNPTDSSIVFDDTIHFDSKEPPHGMLLIYKASNSEVNKIIDNPFYGIGDFYAVSQKRTINPKVCLTKTVEVKTILSLEEKELKNTVSQEAFIQSFSMDVYLYKNSNVYKDSGTLREAKIFFSDFFDLQ